MNFVYFTEKFRKKIKGTPHEEILYDRVRSLSKYPDLSALNSVDPYRNGKVIVYKLQKSYTSRIIILIKKIKIKENDINFLFVVEYVPKVDFSYRWPNVIQPTLTDDTWVDNNQISEDELKKAKREYVEILDKKQKPKNPPPPEMTKWLDKFSAKIDFDIFEYEDWVKYSAKPYDNGLEDKYEILFKKLFQQIFKEIKTDTYQNEKIQTNLYSLTNVEDNIGIIYSIHYLPERGKPIYIVRGGAHLKKQKEYWKKIKEKVKTIDITGDNNLEIVSQKAFRAYPEWILNEEGSELWELIQRYKGNYNLSLLPEQIEFLSNFKFPTYINGQAGSGKSTMLYYLLAEVFFHKLVGEFKGDIIFLTENQQLLENTKTVVMGLLESNPAYSYNISLEEKNLVRKSFSVFNDFLINLLPEEEKERYPANKYMDFAKFKSLYKKNYRKVYSAEEVWFVINTYVVGYDENKLIKSRQDYETLVVRDFRVIEANRFDDIVSATFPMFEKLIKQEGYWTKTTLVRNIRKIYPDELPSNYEVVFCDEAQDFTRIELRLIIHSSAYMRYDMTRTDKIPIAFAGDALQTVSPNRFTVTRLRQMYYDIFKESNYDYNKDRQERSIYNPEFNYRSSKSIVRIANVVQQFRQKYIEENNNEYVKQKSKRTDEGIVRPFLHYKEWLSKDGNFDLYRKKFKYKSFIIPTDLDAKEEYVSEEHLLSPQKNSDESTGLSTYFTDIKSSINAKGAEYNQVVVYGFGDYYVNNFEKLDRNINKFDFKLKFFFNKLYVAVTRAQNELIIIDSKNGADNFWQPLFSITNNLPDSWERFEIIEDIIWINPKTGLEKVAESTREDALKNAQKDKEQGILDKNTIRLKVAASTFQINGRTKDAYECEAYCYEINEKWEKAGELFEKADNLEKAAEAYFKGEKWGKIPRSIEGNAHKAKILIATLMSTGSWVEDDIGYAYDLSNSIYKALNGVSWYDEFSDKLRNFMRKVEKSEYKRNVAAIGRNIVREEDDKLWRELARLYYDTKQLKEAITCWDKYLFKNDVLIFPINYIKAKAELAKDKNDKFEELLWQGRLLNNEKYIAENGSEVAIDFCNVYTETNIENQNADYKGEIYLYLLRSKAILGKKDEIHIVAGKIEEDGLTDEALKEFYEKSIPLVRDDSISLFLLERLIYRKVKLLKKKHNVNEISDDVLNELGSYLINNNFSKQGDIWSITEIEQINKNPRKILTTPPNHIKNISIYNYRKFTHLELNNIGTYNLILGDNNAGKTTLIEALLFSTIPDEQAMNLIYTYNLRKNHTNGKVKHILEETINNKVNGSGSIQFVIAENRQKWEYTLRHPTTKEIRRKTGIDTANPKNYIVLEQKNSETKLPFSKPIENIEVDTTKIPFVPYGKGYADEISKLYFRLIGMQTKKIRREFCKYIGYFIPNIEEIVIGPDDDSIRIEEEDMEQSSPLYNYGEGANKLFRILVQLYAAKGKRLMIDEIDAGIHYSRFKDFWRVILLTAKDLEVQLFVTTHNEECIQYFHEVLLEEELSCCREASRIITLEYLEDEDRVIPIIRDFENIDYALERDLEIRGNQ